MKPQSIFHATLIENNQLKEENESFLLCVMIKPQPDYI